MRSTHMLFIPIIPMVQQRTVDAYQIIPSLFCYDFSELFIHLLGLLWIRSDYLLQLLDGIPPSPIPPIFLVGLALLLARQITLHTMGESNSFHEIHSPSNLTIRPSHVLQLTKDEDKDQPHSISSFPALSGFSSSDSSVKSMSTLM